jgi:phage-related protein
MPTFPTTPPPRRVSPFGLIDPHLAFQVDQGYEQRRPRFSRRRHTYQLEYQVTAAELLVLTDFLEREVRSGALAFDWRYPYAQRMTQIDSNTPNRVTTLANHGYQSGDQVTLSNTSFHNGTYTVTRVSATILSLGGTSGGTPETTGGITRYYPAMVVRLAEGRLAPPALDPDFGPMRDEDGLCEMHLVFEEVF